MSLGGFAAVLQWVKKLGIQTGQAREVLGVKLVGFALTAVDANLAIISVTYRWSRLSLTFGDRGSSRVMNRRPGAGCISLANSLGAI